MPAEASHDDIDTAQREELEQAATHRREADLRLSMNERLAALHHLCLQASQIRGAAKRG
jgi:hypothetical protein